MKVGAVIEAISLGPFSVRFAKSQLVCHVLQCTNLEPMWGTAKSCISLSGLFPVAQILVLFWMRNGTGVGLKGTWVQSWLTLSVAQPVRNRSQWSISGVLD